MSAPATSEQIGGAATAPALEIRDLEVDYRVRGIWREVLRGISFTVERGTSYGLVGESGCGKSTAALAAIRYLPRNGRVRSGSIEVAGVDVLALRGRDLQRYRGDVVSMVYQNPGTALNPSIRVGKQLAEVFTARGSSRGEARERSLAMLRQVQIADPTSVMQRYPHQLSGGMQQRVVIAMALGVDPELLILDEPTTGLDATVEAEVLDLINRLQAEFHTAVLFISHNLGVIRKMCDRVGVLYAGEMVEEGAAEAVLHDPRHPYTVGLLRCIPRGGVRKDHGRLDTIPGFLPTDRRGSARLRVRRSLRAGRGHLPRAEARNVPRRGGHFQPLLLPPARSGAAARDGSRSRGRQDGSTAASRPSDRDRDPPGQVFIRAAHSVHALGGVSSAIWPGETLGLSGVRPAPTLDDVRARTARHRRADQGRRLARWQGARADAPKRTGADVRGAPDRVPEPGLGAQPPPHGAPDPAPLAQAPGRDHRQCSRATHPQP